MSVVGIDFGTYSCYIAVARAGGIETIANEYSDRQTPSYISFNEKNRCMGVAAKQQAVMKFKNTVAGIKRLVGRKYNDSRAQREMKIQFSQNDIFHDTKDGNIFIKVDYLGENQQFSPEQITAMLFTKLKLTAEAALKTKVVDVVISVPSYCTDVERRAFLDASQMAGLNCLRLLSDTTAASLAYGIYKQDLPAENEKGRNVVIVDMGYAALQVSICSFHKGKLKVLAVSNDPDLGGRNFDQLLLHQFSEEFKTKYKIDVMSRPKAYIRLLQECEKLKKLMSANTQKIPLNVECLMDDKDVTSGMDRTTFEELASKAGLLTRVENTMRAILDYSNVKLGDVHSVEVVGGSSRLPCVKALVNKVFNMEPSTTLNSDEAVSRGCALQCAILSPTFRVRDFNITDCQPYSITLHYTGSVEDENSLEVFSKFHPIPFSKMLTFYRKEPFELTARYTYPKEVPYPSDLIASFKINNIVPHANGDSNKVKLKVRINNQGIFVIPSASMYEKLDQDEDKDQESMDVDDEEKKAEESSSGETMKSDDSPESEVKKAKKTTRSIDLPIESSFLQLPKHQLTAHTDSELKFNNQDKLEKERLDAKNAVEEYVYDMRDKLGGIYEQYATEDDRNALTLNLEDTENWLYEDGEDVNKEAYVDKLKEIKNKGDPIKTRYQEAQVRPAVFDELGKSILQYRKFLDEWAKKDEKYDHIDKADVDKVDKCARDKMDWYEKHLNLQKQTPLHQDPPISSHEINEQRKALDAVCKSIVNKPKPKVEPPKEEKKEEKKDDAKNGAGDKGTSEANDSTKPPNPNATPDMEVD
ncbi:hypothetical protein LOTGIDRAFT_111562 [Lottia gigantea]|uniref:Uncharacterized protein n=1 Tax=Lottia gigantea TaxID=225164 RepID=V4ADQ9_LOTGI|nr:hypothetical protein LOTGIDRAFT_111562 [Lottia gigantea]ESP02149.1 hypothetical protein LOTGIDRAFT_111562 [Lottia gigantea]